MQKFLPVLSVALAMSTFSVLAAGEKAAERRPKPPVAVKSKAPAKVYPTMGTIERDDPRFDLLISTNAVIEKLAEGFDWSEGPVWNWREKALFFSDVPRNVVFKWVEGVGTREYLMPSGYSGKTPRGGEPGSNGLTLDPSGRLILCQHGDRQVGRLEKDKSVTPLAEFYQWRRFNSPNDLVYKSNGDLYFTDPPYGLLKLNEDPTKELPFNGVYCLKRNGEVVLLTRDLSFPNGIAFSPDEKTLYVAISDPRRAVWMAYDVKPDGGIQNGRVFFDSTSLMAGKKGLPDGLKVDREGNLFATGPGGVLVFSPDGTHLGTINTGEATANCGFGEDGTTLYITADMYLCRIRTLTKGLGF